MEYFSDNDKEIYFNIKKLADNFIDAKEYGAIITVDDIDFDCITNRLGELKEENNLLYNNLNIDLLEITSKLVNQAIIMKKNYKIFITNPPYFSSSDMNLNLESYVKKYYPLSATDLFSVFMELGYKMSETYSYIAMINQHSWMFLKSYSQLREKILMNKTIINMLHLGPRAFEEINGDVVQTTAFVMRNNHTPNFNATYINLKDEKKPFLKEQKALAIINGMEIQDKYIRKSTSFLSIRDTPISYWSIAKLDEFFLKFKNIGSLMPVKKGMDTGNNDKYLRLWSEVNFKTIGLDLNEGNDTIKYSKKWVPYDKGGNYRKWFGNNEYIVWWKNDGEDLKNSKANIRSKQLYFNKSITWNALATKKTCFRYSMFNSIFDSAGSSMFPKEEYRLYTLGLMNSKVIEIILEMINPTLNFGAGTVSKVPYVYSKNNEVEVLVNRCIEITKKEWDSYETSWILFNILF